MVYYLGMPYHARTNAYFEWDSIPEQHRYFGLSGNLPLDSSNLPDAATRQRGKQTPDVFPMPGLNAVNARFRDLVEKFEPDRHLFHPTTLKEADGSRVPGEFYIFCARVAIDCVLTVRSAIQWESGSGEYPPSARLNDRLWEKYHPDHRKSEARREAKFGIIASAAARGVIVQWPQHLYVSKPAIEGHHIWTGARLFSSDIWV